MSVLGVMDSAFEQVRGNQRSVTVSMLSNGKTSHKIEDTTKYSDKSVITGVTYAEKPALYEFLFNFGFVTSLLTLVSSTIQDIITKNSLDVSIDYFNDKVSKEIVNKATEKCNSFLHAINLTETIINDLPLYLYFGNYVYMVDFAKRQLKRVTHPHNVIQVERYCKNDTFMLYDKDYKDQSNLRSINTNECFVFQYNKIKINEVTELEVFKNELAKKKLSEKATKDAEAEYLRQHPLSDRVVKYTYYQGRGIFHANMNQLLLYYMKQLLSDLLGLKDTMLPSVLMARIASDDTDDAVIDHAINEIEALVNDNSTFDPSTSLSNFDSIQSILTSIQNYLANGIKVVPGLNNFTNLEPIKLPDILGKRDALRNELEEQRRRILTEIGIPEELYMGQTSRWDALTRSARYLTLVEGWTTEVVSMVKSIALTWIKLNYPTELKNVTIDDIKINLDSNNIIFNSYSNTRSRVIGEKLDAIQRTIRTAQDLMESPLVDREKMLDYMRLTMEAIDPKALDVILKKLPMEAYQQQY